MTSIPKAIASLRPNSEWSLIGDDYEGLEWFDRNELPPPTKEEVFAEIERLKEVEKNNEYKSLRAAEYPPITDYLDGIVKGDQEQIQAYIDMCLAVKEKYPKPEL